MTENDVQILAHMAGLKIDPAYIPGVLRNLDVLREQAKLLGDAPVEALVEPAPVFRP